MAVSGAIKRYITSFFRIESKEIVTGNNQKKSIMKKKICLMLLLGGLCSSSVAKDYLVSTPNTSLLITAVPGEKSKFQYYGSRIEERDIQGVYDSGQAFGVESYPVFGLNTPGERP